MYHALLFPVRKMAVSYIFHVVSLVGSDCPPAPNLMKTWRLSEGQQVPGGRGQQLQAGRDAPGVLIQGSAYRRSGHTLGTSREREKV